MGDEIRSGAWSQLMNNSNPIIKEFRLYRECGLFFIMRDWWWTTCYDRQEAKKVREYEGWCEVQKTWQLFRIQCSPGARHDAKHVVMLFH